LYPLQSSNGTFVNGDQLRKNAPTTLHDGDKIHVFKPR
jgi:pSer/pThr/pTyr-binding forkhead associated (FHA) protein